MAKKKQKQKAEKVIQPPSLYDDPGPEGPSGPPGQSQDCCGMHGATGLPMSSSRLAEPNTQASFEETVREIEHVESRLGGVENEVEFCKDQLARLKLRRQELSDALVKKVREGLRASL